MFAVKRGQKSISRIVRAPGTKESSLLFLRGRVINASQDLQPLFHFEEDPQDTIHVQMYLHPQTFELRFQKLDDTDARDFLHPDKPLVFPLVQ
jgi:hypothetical protein